MPLTSVEFKIVQIKFDDELYLLCGEGPGKQGFNYYHKNLVEDFLLTKNLKAGEDYKLVKTNPDDDESVRIPSVSLEGYYQLLGAGFAQIDENSKFVFPYGGSMDYEKIGLKGVEQLFNNYLKRDAITKDSELYKHIEEVKEAEKNSSSFLDF